MRMILGILIGVITLFGATRPAVPVVPPNQTYDYQCKVPDWLVSLPPVLEKDYKECLNERNKPSAKKVETVLKQMVSKEAEFVSIDIADAFYARVYRVVYTIGQSKKNIICNESLSYCLEDNPVVNTIRRSK